ncbi:DUF2569 family protein [Alicyclobacillus sp. SO9]|uniref:DUF2569 family protein n=1 Tax=Alicyclobacillus sp. SO9 TaxID=2665646 RepID=UPI0018E8F992|nr:DUF2569 family protein [Alicyclobacillus sp. SO9]QQE79317.1 DUF2569 family protein [Alicyclobacillus sp. SO9]
MAGNFSEVQTKIRGWLILIGIVLWVDVILYSVDFIAGLLVSHKLLFTTPYEVQAADYFINAAANIVILFLFMSKKKSFVGWMLAYQIYSIVVELVIVVLNIVHHIGFWKELVALIIPVAILLYIVRSERVKKTFVH